MQSKPWAFSLNSPRRLNQLITTVGISIPGKTDPLSFNAIWDTGATGTSISTEVARSLGLKPSGVADVHTANGPARQNTYIVDIHLPNRVNIPTVMVTEVDALVGNCQALIGMNIIMLGDFSITHLNGETCFSFRIPSLHKIDYVENPLLRISNHAPAKGVRISRNSKCPCGSGKKYKHCCGSANH